MVRLIFNALVLFSMLSCTKFSEDDRFELSKEPYLKNNLRIDGYYYLKENGAYNSMYCFYRNGVLLYLGAASNDEELRNLEERIRNGTYYRSVQSINYFWGLYSVNGDTIKFEKYFPPGSPFRAYVRSGVITSDSSFAINSSYRSHTHDVRVKNEPYIFKKFSPKPDSTNPFF